MKNHVIPLKILESLFVRSVWQLKVILGISGWFDTILVYFWAENKFWRKKFLTPEPAIFKSGSILVQNTLVIRCRFTSRKHNYDWSSISRPIEIEINPDWLKHDLTSFTAFLRPSRHPHSLFNLILPYFRISQKSPFLSIGQTHSVSCLDCWVKRQKALS